MMKSLQHILATSHKYSLFFSVFVILLTVLNLSRQLYVNRTLYQERFDPEFFRTKYQLSQWVDPESKALIGDEDLYAISGYEYVHGKNPILMNPEVPPLGKYLIGLGIEWFGNQRAAGFLFGIGTLIGLWVWLYQLTKHPLVASVAVWLLGTNSLFVDQFLHSPQLEIFQLAFLLLALGLLAKTLASKKIMYAVLAGLAFGAFISIKVFLVHFAIAAGTIGLAILISNTKWKEKFILGSTVGISMLVFFTLTYTQYFMLGGTPRGFLGTQKWIYTFYSGSNIQTSKIMGSYLTLIFADRWTFWSEGYPVRSYESWSLIWPIQFTIAVAVAVWVFAKQKVKNVKYPSVWIAMNSFLLTYAALLFFIPIYPRYLLIFFLPIMVDLALLLDTFLTTVSKSKNS